MYSVPNITLVLFWEITKGYVVVFKYRPLFMVDDVKLAIYRDVAIIQVDLQRLAIAPVFISIDVSAQVIEFGAANVHHNVRFFLLLQPIINLRLTELPSKLFIQCTLDLLGHFCHYALIERTLGYIIALNVYVSIFHYCI